MKKIVISLVLLVFISTGCATYKSQMLAVMPVDNYAVRSEVKGLKVAVDPYDTAQKAEAGFYVDLTKGGYVPINLIFENRTNDRYLVLRNQVSLLGSNGNTYYPLASGVVADDMAHNAMAYAFFGGIFSYMSADDANKKMRRDWYEKELPDSKIAEAGIITSGVVFFKLPTGSNVLSGAVLTVPIENLNTRERSEVKVTITQSAFGSVPVSVSGVEEKVIEESQVTTESGTSTSRKEMMSGRRRK